jgi:hypothetical protein
MYSEIRKKYVCTRQNEFIFEYMYIHIYVPTYRYMSTYMYDNLCIVRSVKNIYVPVRMNEHFLYEFPSVC